MIDWSIEFRNHSGVALIPYPVVRGRRQADARHRLENDEAQRVDAYGPNMVYYDPRSRRGFIMENGLHARNPLLLCFVYQYLVPPGLAGRDYDLQPRKIGRTNGYYFRNPPRNLAVTLNRHWDLEFAENFGTVARHA